MKIQEVTLEDKVFNLGFKVVTLENKSLGLRKNPHIMYFPVHE